MAKQGDRRREIDVITAQGKVPPQDIAAEAAVLASLIIEGSVFVDISHLLKPEYFYKEAHRLIYQAIEKLEGVGCDIITLTNQLRKEGNLEAAGGPYYLTQLSGVVASTAHLRYHVELIRQTYQLREAIRLGHAVTESAFANSHDDVHRYEAELSDVLTWSIGKDIQLVGDVVDSTVQNIMDVVDGDKEIIGLPTGFFIMDRLLYGLQKGDLIIIAGRPSMGKTALALSIGKNVAGNKIPVGIFSLEMSTQSLTVRLISMDSGISSGRFKVKNGLTPKDREALGVSKKLISGLPVFIDDTPALGIFDLKAKARRMKKLYGIELLIVDYIQLISAPKEVREQEISLISRQLKALAKELNIPVVALSQLSRAVENRRERKPILSDLRESGAIEQDADIVAFVYRPEFAGIKQFEDGTSTEGLAEIIVAKNRNGAVGDIVMRFEKSTTLFVDLQSNREEGPVYEQKPLWHDEAPF